MASSLNPSDVSAVLVTRGDVDLGPVLNSLPFSDVVIWDNSRRPDLKVFGRYAAVDEAKSEWIYTQDDDCIVDVAALLAVADPACLTCNMPEWKRPEYPGRIALVGWGAIFPRKALAAFDRYTGLRDELFMVECDRVFTGLNCVKRVDVPFRHLPWATDGSRLGARPDHWKRMKEIEARLG